VNCRCAEIDASILEKGVNETVGSGWGGGCYFGADRVGIDKQAMIHAVCMDARDTLKPFVNTNGQVWTAGHIRIASEFLHRRISVV
jgi:hypothetical protein